ncbi:MAG: glycosyltransferase family 2 protein [Planctomycetota bacterium]|nr:glycosyltransferase family 2 protein [Planctomycetota bacterium]
MTVSYLASVVVVNYNGGDTLRACIESIITQQFARSDREVIIIDNGSRDDSLDGIRDFVGIRVIRKERNLGFAAAANLGAEVALGEHVAFINSDARLDPSWLSKMIEEMGKAKAECATSRIDSWDGTEKQYEGGVVSFGGHCWEEAFSREQTRRWILFPHGAAMLVRRDTFLDVGGFDPDYFAYFEDVDLGWRLNLLGHRVAIVPGAIAYHKGQGTAGKISYAQRLLLFERNALMTIYKNYDEENLRRVLPGAILLTLSRGFARAKLRPSEYLPGGEDEMGREEIPRPATATFLAVEEFTNRLGELEKRRRAIQDQRIVPDDEILRLFGDPFRAHEFGKTYRRVFDSTVDLFGIREVFQS